MLSRLLIARTRCHSTSSTSPTSSFRPKRQSQPNPLHLSPAPSVGYTQNGSRQTHFAYPACFQQFNLIKRLFFSKRVVQRSGNRRSSPARHDMSCSPSRQPVTCQRAEPENMPTIEAGRSFGISGVPGKPQIRVAGLNDSVITCPDYRETEAKDERLKCGPERGSSRIRGLDGR